MKFNWGTGILLFFLFFAICMVSAVVATHRYPPQLVQEDYYALDLAYQERLEKKQHTDALATPPNLQFDAATQIIRIVLPMTAQSGTAHGYRSATTRDDRSLPFTNTSVITIPAADFFAGRWHLELDWTADNTAYFWETTFSK